jgi:hypothetical protein
MNIILIGVRPNAEEEGEQTEVETVGKWGSFLGGLGGAFEGSADSQADGFAESAAQASSAGEASGPFQATHNGDAYRDSVESVGAGGIPQPYDSEPPLYPTESEEEYKALLDVAGLLVETDPVTGPFASVHVDPDGYAMGRINAVKQLIGTVAEVLKHTMPHSRSRSLALTKLEEASMWATNGIARGE